MPPTCKFNGTPKTKYLNISAVDQLHNDITQPVSLIQAKGKRSSAQEKGFARFQDSFCPLVCGEAEGTALPLKSFKLKGFALLTQPEPKLLSSWREELRQAEAAAAKLFH